jgi:hypothetical protein
MIWSCICGAMVSLLLTSPQQTFDVATVKRTSRGCQTVHFASELPQSGIRPRGAPAGCTTIAFRCSPSCSSLSP